MSRRSAEAREAFLARFHALHGGPVLLQEVEHLAAGQHDPDVAVQDLAAGSRSVCGWSLAHSRRWSISSK